MNSNRTDDRSQHKPEKPKTLQGIVRAVKNIAPAVIQAVNSLSTVNPGLSLVMSSALSIIGFYSDYANDKAIEYLQALVENKDKFVDDVVNSEKFKSVFIRMLNEYITEGNEKRRLYIKNYVVNLACGVEREFDEHTRVMNLIGSISLEEVEMLMMWKDGGIIEAWYNNNLGSNRQGMSLDVNDINRILIDNRLPLLFQNGEPVKRDRANQILLSLGSKDLLWTLGANNFGSGVEAKTKGITRFGKVFLKFIQD